MAEQGPPAFSRARHPLALRLVLSHKSISEDFFVNRDEATPPAPLVRSPKASLASDPNGGSSPYSAYSIYSAYSAYSAYSVYSAYSAYSAYSVYSPYSAYSTYSAYSIYSAYSAYSAYSVNTISKQLSDQIFLQKWLSDKLLHLWQVTRERALGGSRGGSKRSWREALLIPPTSRLTELLTRKRVIVQDKISSSLLPWETRITFLWEKPLVAFPH